MLHNLRKRLGNWGIRWLYSRSVIATIDGIQIVSLRSDHSEYLSTISLSLKLLKENDQRRMDRVLTYAKSIVDRSLADGATAGQYCYERLAIEMDFEFSSDFGDELRHAAYFAGVLVHEATHGFLDARGFEYNEENRVQIERICRAEENRFLARMNAVRENLGDSLTRNFDAKVWESSWKMGSWERFKRSMKRVLEIDKSEQGGSRNLARRG